MDFCKSCEFPLQFKVRCKLEKTEYGKSFLYNTVYSTWTDLLIMFLVPLTTLAVLNTLIYLQIQKAKKTRSQMVSKEKDEHSLAMMFISVVVVFMICNTFR